MPAKKGKSTAPPSLRNRKKNHKKLSTDLHIGIHLEPKATTVNNLVKQIFELGKEHKDRVLKNLVTPLCEELKLSLVAERMFEEDPRYYLENTMASDVETLISKVNTSKLGILKNDSILKGYAMLYSKVIID